MSEPFAEELWNGAVAEWPRILDHPFVAGLATGSLPMERYLFYLRQDYVFLLDYARVLALAAAAADDPGDMRGLAGLLHATLDQELQLHRRTCADLGVGAAELAAAEAAPFTFAYTRHLLATAHAGPLGAIAAALLPCQWGYALIGRALSGQPRSPVPAYADWIATYASAEYGETARWVWDLCNRCGAELGAAGRRRAHAAFRASFGYEYQFWDGCWHGGR